MKFYDQVIRVPIDNVKANSYNPFGMDEKTMAKEIRSIEKDGFVGAIEVRLDPDKTDCYIIVDGEQRYNAAKKVGYKEIPIIVTDKDDLKEAKITTIKRNTLKGSVDTIKMASLINNLMEEHKATASELAEELGWSDDTIERLRVMEEDSLKNIDIEKMNKTLLEDKSETLDNIFEVVVTCKDESEQKKIYNFCTENGYKFRIIAL